jgi:opacity protein-like surface antigen
LLFTSPIFPMAKATGGGGGGDGAAFVDSNGDNDDDVGFVIGTGMDVKLSDRFSVGMEGLYYAFDDDDVDFFVVDGDRVGSIDSNNDFYVARARITYHFR